MISILPITIFINFTDKRFELTGSGKECSDIGKETLNDIAECKAATKDTGKSFTGAFTWNGYPKGCFFIHTSVYWNNHKSGTKNLRASSICRDRRKYIVLYHIEEY